MEIYLFLMGILALFIFFIKRQQELSRRIDEESLKVSECQIKLTPMNAILKTVSDLLDKTEKQAAEILVLQTTVSGLNKVFNEMDLELAKLKELMETADVSLALTEIMRIAKKVDELNDLVYDELRGEGVNLNI